jgi:ribosome-associated protein
MNEKEIGLFFNKLSHLIVKGMQKKKANEIRVLDLRKIDNAAVDFFIVCSANSDTHMQAIAKSIEEEAYTDKQKPWHKEGYTSKNWVLLDYIDIVAHIFSKEDRSFYGIEDLWADAEITKI